MHFVSDRRRKILQAILYEIIAVILISPCLALIFDESLEASGLLAVVISLIAVVWNYVFNTLFERWERRHDLKERPLRLRIAHAALFEGGLVLMTVPLIACWLDLSLWHALITDLALLVFFFFYAIVYHWAFDKMFGLPKSAVSRRVP